MITVSDVVNSAYIPYREKAGYIWGGTQMIAVDSERNHCVYVHIFPNGKLYIGQAMHPVTRRWRKDGYGYRSCPLMWNAIKKYGWENVKHTILLDHLTKDEANYHEKRLIFMFMTTRGAGYNIAEGGKSAVSIPFASRHKIAEANRRRVVSEETRHKMSEQRKGIKNYFYGKHFVHEITDEQRSKMSKRFSGENNPMYGMPSKERKKVICVETGVVYDSVTDAARSVNGDVSSVSAVCRKRHETHRGFHWEYYDQCDKGVV